MSAQKRVQPPLVPLEQFAPTPGGRTFVPTAAPAPAAPVRWPERDDVVAVTDGDLRQAKAMVTGVAVRDGVPAVTVRTVDVGLRLPTSDNGLLRFSERPRAFTWRWPDA